MKNRIVLALAVAVLMAAPAFAAVQNVKVSGDIDSTYLNRDNFNFDKLTDAGGVIHQSVFVSQTRLRVDADLSDNVSATVRLLDERAWGTGSNSSNATNLDLAYVTLREFLYSPLTVTVGRQEFVYGNGLILGGNGPNNGSDGQFATVAGDLTKQASQDGVKLVLDYKPLTVDMVYIKNSINPTPSALGTANQTNLNSSKSDVDVYGVNANYQLGDAMNTVVEGYMFAKIDHSNWDTKGKGQDTYVPGLRVSTNPIKGLNTQAEVAFEGGKATNLNTTAVGSETIGRKAMAAQLMASYDLSTVAQPIAKYKPSVNASFSYFSGDKYADNAAGHADKVYKAWDPMFEGQNGGTIFNALFNLSNLYIFNVGASVNPIQDVTTSFNWYNLRLAEKTGAATMSLVQPNGDTNGVSESITNKKGLGNEYDASVNYAYTEDVTLGLTLGWYVPGDAFAKSNNTAASQAMAHVNVNF